MCITSVGLARSFWVSDVVVSLIPFVCRPCWLALQPLCISPLLVSLRIFETLHLVARFDRLSFDELGLAHFLWISDALGSLGTSEYRDFWLAHRFVTFGLARQI